MIEYLDSLPDNNILEKKFFSEACLVPRGLVRGENAYNLMNSGKALSLCGYDIAFCAIELIIKVSKKIYIYSSNVEDFQKWIAILNTTSRVFFEDLLYNFLEPRSGFLDFTLNRPLIMGVVNVTPDSFSDGGDFYDFSSAIDHSIKLIESGADIIDIGGETSRPGALPIDPHVEQQRIIPVIKYLSEKGFIISVDTRNASTMNMAIESGAKIINDITALTGDSKSLSVISNRNVFVVLMHMKGEPQKMQVDPNYNWAPLDVFSYLKSRLKACESSGIIKSRIIVDPGIGFGKSHSHNIEIITHLFPF